MIGIIELFFIIFSMGLGFFFGYNFNKHTRDQVSVSEDERLKYVLEIQNLKRYEEMCQDYYMLFGSLHNWKPKNCRCHLISEKHRHNDVGIDHDESK